MYLRETKRRNADGSTVSYLALAQNERDPVTGVPRARIIHRFGRADQVDLEVQLLFLASTWTYWETGRLPDELQDDGDEPEEDPSDQAEEPVLVESGRRRCSKHSKDRRPDLPQVVVGMAVTRKGIP